MKKISCNYCKSSVSRELFRGKDRLHQTTDQQFIIAKCNNCGLVFLNPQPEISEIAKYYPSNYGPHGANENIFKHSAIYSLFRSIYKIFNKKKPFASSPQFVQKVADKSSKNFLDFGCGNGNFLLQIRNKHPNWNLYGLDISPNACIEASKKGFNIHCGTLESAKYESNLFDIINSSQVIEHLPNPRMTLGEINRILKLGGTLTIDIPNFSSFGASIFRSYWFCLDVPRHLYFFTPLSISKLLQDVGFEVKKIHYNYTGGDTILAHSIDYFLHKRNTGINPLVYLISKPLNKFLKKIGYSDLMYLEAIKKNDVKESK